MSNVSKIKTDGVLYDIEDSTARADISDLKSQIDQSAGLTEEIKQALMNLANAVAFKGDDPTGQTYIDALEDALYPPVNLTSISAVYTQSGTVDVTDSLDSLKSDLVVTANWSDGTTTTVADTDYTLSGTLTTGTSAITVSYAGKTATFDVTVTSEYTWYYKASDGQTLTDRTDIVTKNITAGTIQEEIVDGLLHIIAPTGSNGCKWDFVQNTNTSAVLRMRFKLISAGVSNGFNGFQPQLSNGTGGAKIGITRHANNGDAKAVTAIGTATTDHNFSLNEWHTLELELISGKQTVSIDGVALVENVNQCASYCVNNRIFVQNAGTVHNTEVYIDWIGYINRSA